MGAMSRIDLKPTAHAAQRQLLEHPAPDPLALAVDAR
jgi:hypothetical protein